MDPAQQVKLLPDVRLQPDVVGQVQPVRAEPKTLVVRKELHRIDGTQHRQARLCALKSLSQRSLKLLVRLSSKPRQIQLR